MFHQLYIEDLGQLMMHYSQKIIDQQMGENNFKAKQTHVKVHGFYFQFPEIQKQLMNKSAQHRIVFQSGIIENQANNLSQFLQLMKSQLFTVKSINIKLLSEQNDKIKKEFRKHYRIIIKNYIKRAYQKQAYEIPLEALEILRSNFLSLKQSNNNSNIDRKQYFKTEQLLICKPFFLNGNLESLLSESKNQDWKFDSTQEENDNQKRKVLKKSNIPHLLRQLLKCSIEFGGLDNFIMTLQNLYFEQNWKTLRINYTSFTGIALIKAQSSIGPYQFNQISAYLTPKMLQQGKIGVQDKIRFFLLNTLSILSKKQFSLLTEQVDQSRKFSHEQITEMITKNGYQFSEKIIEKFREELNDERMINQLKILKRYNIDIQQKLRKGLIENEQLSWQQIVLCICKGRGNQQKQSKQINKQDMIKIDDQRMASNTVVLNQKKKKIQRNKQYGKKIFVACKELHKRWWREEQNQQFYQQRNIQSQFLYIPIKFMANFNLIFEYEAWWEIFNIKDKQGVMNKDFYNFLHFQFALKLLNKRSREQAVNFINDPIIEILFQYLKCSQQWQWQVSKDNEKQSKDEIKDQTNMGNVFAKKGQQ